MHNIGLLSLLDDLVASGIPCVVIGGFAVNFHGYVRATEDLDLIVRRTPEIDEQLFSVLSKWDSFWISDEIDPATNLEFTRTVTPEYIRQHHLLMLGTRVGYLDIFDFIPGMPGEPVEEVFRTAITIDQRSFVSLEWLKRMKQAAGRPQDRLDLDHLP